MCKGEGIWEGTSDHAPIQLTLHEGGEGEGRGWVKRTCKARLNNLLKKKSVRKKYVTTFPSIIERLKVATTETA